MNVEGQIEEQIASQPEPKRSDMRELHQLALRVSPGCKLWFHDGRDERGRTICNPTIGYGSMTLALANGKTRESFRVGLSANTTGISIYLIGLEDKTLKDVRMEVLEAVMRYGFERGAEA